ncbi:leucine-rich repeat protein [Jutongia sp.]|uniref:leucine-rich repeat protein n=1 Tax=Jutongia sp. TaxID=2944204 RepID=UPI00307AF0E8
MKQKKKRRKVQAILMILVMLMSVSVLQGVSGKRLLSARAAGESVTRGEWIHNLVSTFDMKMEEGLVPDTYYPDIVGTTYYSDIQTAIYFGVVDLEAGESFEPDAAVDREFAAHTLSFCMGYDTSDVTYTMDDEADLTYPGDDQTAVDMGWLALQDGKFAPSQEITTTESQNMLQSAKKVLDASGVDENHENVYKFADNVIELPESVTFDKGEDGQIIVHDTSVELKEGDVFAVYSDGIAYTYKALSITKEGNDLIINTEKVMYDDAVESVDAEGVIDADLADFIPAEGVEAEVEYEDQTTVKGMHKISGVKSVKSINVSKSIGAGTVTCSISDITVDYRIDKNGYRFAVYGKVDPSFTFSGKKDLVITLGTIPVAQVGKIEVKAVCSAKGSATVGFTTNAVVGVEQKVGHAPRHLANYTSPQWRFSAKAELKAACDLSFSVEVPMAAEGKVYGEVGVKTTPDMEVYTDGKKPQVCIDLPVYVFAEAGYSVKVFGYDMASGKKPIYDASNSPVKLCYHIEDGNCVPACTRPDSSSRVGKRGYYTSPSLQSGVGNTYGSQAFVAPYVEKKVFEYTLDDDGNATITKYDGNVRALTIPDTLDGYTVVAIGSSAFAKNTYLQSVVIPDTVTVIQESAFAECTNLSQIHLSDNLEYMYDSAFGYCNSLNNVCIPKTLVECYSKDFFKGEGGPFRDCINLKNISFEEGITNIPKKLFYRCTGIEKINIPDTVIMIDDRAFKECTSLKNIQLSNNLTTIGQEAFNGCTSLEKVVIPNSVTTIKGAAFLACSKLSDVTLSKNLLSLGGYAFGDCDSLESIEIPKSIETTTEEYYIQYIYGYQWGVFIACDNLKEIIFEKGTTQIAKGMFANNESIEQISIPDTVTLIGDQAFLNCTSLSDVQLSQNLITVGQEAFMGCTSITKIKIPDSVTTIKGAAFLACSDLSDVTLSRNLISLGGYAFGDCDSLESIEIPKSVKDTTSEYYGQYIYDYQWGVFIACDNLKNITFEKETTQIVYGMFANNESIEKIEIPETVTTIGSDAFYKCTSLTEINIPDTVLTVGSYAFGGCKNLEKVHLPKNIKNIEKGTFKDCSVLKDITIPDTVMKIGDVAFSGCTALPQITLPASVQTIGDKAFSHCEALADVKLSEGLTSIGSYAFEHNIALPKVTLPNTLESLGERAFQYCDVLADVDLGAGLKVIPEYCFYKDPALQKVILPYQFTTVNASAFANCTKLTDITFNRNVSSVDASALSYKDKTTIHGVKGTYAESFASDNGFKFEALNAPATGITLSKEKIEIAKDKSIRLTASLTPVDTSDELTWTSSNEEVATVEDGVVKAVGLGEAEIVAMAGSVTKSCPVKVYQGVNNITLDVTSHTMTIGDFLQLTATIYPKDAEYKDVIWSSNNEDVAVVDQKGLVQAKAYGKVKITATSKDGGLEAVCNVTVEPVAVTEVSLNAKAVTLKVGETYQLKETVLPENATDKTVTWTSSNTKAATVSGGAVTAVGTGSAVIIVKTNSGAKTASCTVTVQGSLPSEGPSVPPTGDPSGIPSVPPTGEPSGSPVVPPTGSPIVSASAKPTGTPSEPVSTTKVTMSMGYAGSDWGDSTFGKTGDSVIVSGDKTYKISYTVKGSDSDILVLSLDTDVTEEEKNPDMNIQVDEITVNGTPITFDPDKISYTIDENGQCRLQFRDAYSGLERSQEALGDEIIPISKGDEICITFTVTGLGKCPEGDDPTASPKPTLKPTTKPDTDPTTSPKATDTLAPSDSAKPSDAPAPSTQPTGTPAPDASRQPSGSGSGFGSTGSGGSLGDSDYLLGTAITSLSNKKGRKLTVRWFRDSNAKGYEVQYATNSKFTKNKKKKMVYRNTGSVTLKKLKKKKTYYVRVRSYNVTGDGKIVYSGWSTKRKIKIKR